MSLLRFNYNKVVPFLWGVHSLSFGFTALGEASHMPRDRFVERPVSQHRADFCPCQCFPSEPASLSLPPLNLETTVTSATIPDYSFQKGSPQTT